MLFSHVKNRPPPTGSLPKQEGHIITPRWCDWCIRLIDATYIGASDQIDWCYQHWCLWSTRLIHWDAGLMLLILGPLIRMIDATNIDASDPLDWYIETMYQTDTLKHRFDASDRQHRSIISDPSFSFLKTRLSIEWNVFLHQAVLCRQPSQRIWTGCIKIVKGIYHRTPPT